MFEYKFVKIDAEVKAFGENLLKEDYHEIIHDHAKDGWRLVQIFAPTFHGYGIAKYIEMIFERQVSA